MQHESSRRLVSGNEAVALAALAAGVKLGTGYPGTPSTEILEYFDAMGGKAQWAPNEKVALEVGIGVAYAGARSLVTMKHVGLNVAADPLFTAAYTGVTGALVIISADDPGMASSQNEQDNRRFAVAAGLPMLEPSDSQEAYAFTLLAIDLSERHQIPVILRMTTRVCHSATVVDTSQGSVSVPRPATYVRDVPGRVMIPAYARPAHRQLRAKLSALAAWNESQGPSLRVESGKELGIITSGISFQHVREAAPGATVLKLGLTHPLPIEAIRAFANSVQRCLIVEEGDPFLFEAIASAGIPVENKAESFRFGELSVTRVRKLIARDTSADPAPPPGKPPELCPGCPHRTVFEALRDLGAIVSGDIGCYTLGVLPPFSAIDTTVCMGASIGVGLGLRHSLPPEQARKVVSVIGDSTFMHSGLTGLAEMLYNPPATGHLLIILDNGTTAMTGLQEHPGTGRTLNHQPTNKIDFEGVARAMGMQNIHIVDPVTKPEEVIRMVREAMGKNELSLIIARRPCLLAAGSIKQREKANAKP